MMRGGRQGRQGISSRRLVMDARYPVGDCACGTGYVIFWIIC